MTMPIKLAYVLCTPDTRAKMPGYRGDYQTGFAALQEIGYQGVELFVRDPRVLDRRQIAKALSSRGLEAVAIGTGVLAADDKLSFTSPDESVRTEAITRVKAVVDFAAELGAQVNVGKLRGDIRKGNVLQATAWRDHAFAELCGYASGKQVNITVEPQNRFVVDNLNTTQQALEWVTEQQQPNLFVMLDVFHMNIEDRSIVASLVEAGKRCMHVHFAENNRGVPGTGHIDFPEIIRVLRAMNYQRYIAIEIDQKQEDRQTAQEAFIAVQRLLAE
jgi:sugar phosphate isomerase/epimerase